MKRAALVFALIVVSVMAMLWGVTVLAVGLQIISGEAEIIAGTLVLLTTTAIELGLIYLIVRIAKALQSPGETVATGQKPAIKQPAKPKARVTPRRPPKKQPAPLKFIGALKAERHYKIRYRAADGKTSERSIIFKRLERKGGYTYLSAVCLMRQSIRTFRADRVLSIIDLRTGEDLAR